MNHDASLIMIRWRMEEDGKDNDSQSIVFVSDIMAISYTLSLYNIQL